MAFPKYTLLGCGCDTIAEMQPCEDQILLLQDERAAHEAVRQMRDAQPENRAGITKLQDAADSASVKLRAHLKDCLLCKRVSWG
jgi:hypothetical protein